MFASNDELYDELTDKEIITIKLCKLDEYAQDLLHLTEKTNGELSMASSSKYNSIQEILVELNNLNLVQQEQNKA
jgi:hypothetical protein